MDRRISGSFKNVIGFSRITAGTFGVCGCVVLFVVEHIAEDWEEKNMTADYYVNDLYIEIRSDCVCIDFKADRQWFDNSAMQQQTNGQQQKPTNIGE